MTETDRRRMERRLAEVDRKTELDRRRADSDRRQAELASLRRLIDTDSRLRHKKRIKNLKLTAFILIITTIICLLIHFCPRLG